MQHFRCDMAYSHPRYLDFVFLSRDINHGVMVMRHMVDMDVGEGLLERGHGFEVSRHIAHLSCRLMRSSRRARFFLLR